MLTVTGLTKSFGALKAVQGISLTVARGEVVGLLGPNGAGKTTTMRLITGYLEPDAGEVTIQGIPVLKNGAPSLEARRLVGYLPENAPLYLDMEVFEFLFYAGALQRIPKKELPQRL